MEGEDIKENTKSKTKIKQKRGAKGNKEFYQR